MSPQPSMPARTQHRYYFGCAEFDPQCLQLSVLGDTVSLERRPLRLLNALLAQADHVVSHEELLETVWGGRVTVRNVLPNAMTKLRKALGEDAKLIVTVPGVGYRLNGPVRVVSGESTGAEIPKPNRKTIAPPVLDVIPLRVAEPGDTAEAATLGGRNDAAGADRSQSFQAFASLPLERRLELFGPLTETVGRRHAGGLRYNAISQADLAVFADGRVLLFKRANGSAQDNHPPVHDPYRPAEIYRGLPGSERSDIYALGVMLYQFLVADLDRPLLGDWQNDVPDAGYRRAIEAATQPDPARRPASVADWLAMFDEPQHAASASWQWMFGLPGKQTRVRT